MKGQILTLFGFEDIQEQPVAKARPERKKKAGEASAPEETETASPEPEPEVTAVAESIEAAEAIPEKADIIPDDWKGEKKYYTIGEVAGFFQVKTSNIRFWTKEFKLKVRTNRKGDRMYTPDQVKEIRAIYHLVKERGFRLAGAKAKLSAEKNKDVEIIDLKESLKSLRDKLVIIRSKLN